MFCFVFLKLSVILFLGHMCGQKLCGTNDKQMPRQGSLSEPRPQGVPLSHLTVGTLQREPQGAKASGTSEESNFIAFLSWSPGWAERGAWRLFIFLLHPPLGKHIIFLEVLGH